MTRWTGPPLSSIRDTTTSRRSDAVSRHDDDEVSMVSSPEAEGGTVRSSDKSLRGNATGLRGRLSVEDDDRSRA